MLQTDDNTTSLLTIGTTQSQVSGEAPKDEFTQSLIESDSITSAVKDSLANMDLKDVKELITGENTLLKDAMDYGFQMLIGFLPKLLCAFLILWVGFKLIRIIKKSLNRVLERRNAESTIRSFLASLLDVTLKILFIIMAMDVIGIKATSFIAVLGAIGLAIGMALQGTLQNFAGGVTILMQNNFKVGDYIEAGSYKGYVREIRIFNTTIQPFNGRSIIIPNSELSNKSLINHTKEPIIRLDATASVAYGTDLDKAKAVLQEVVDSDPLVLQQPKPPTIAVKELGSSSVDIALWLWVKVEDYWTVWKRLNENIYKAFYANGIGIPFPQMDVHVSHESSQAPEPADAPLAQATGIAQVPER